MQGALPTTRLRQPDPADITGPIAFRQQSVAQRGEKRRSIVLRFLDRLSIHSRRSLVAYHLEQRLCQIGDRRHLFEQPTGVGGTGDGSCRFLGLRCVQQESAPAGCVRRSPSPPPCGLSAKAKLS